MTNSDGHTGETSPSEPNEGPVEPSDRPQAQEWQPPSYDPGPAYPPTVDYPADMAPGYPPPPQEWYGGYPAGPSYAPSYAPGYGTPGATSTNAMAIGSLVASVLSFPLFFLCVIGLLSAVVGIGLGIGALSQIKQTGQSGRGLAIAGIALGAAGVLLNGVWILIFGIAMMSAP